MKNHKEKTVLRYTKPLLWGLIVSWILDIGVCMIGSGMIVSGTIEETAAGYCTVIALILGSLGGCCLSNKMAGEHPLIMSAVFGGLFYISLLCSGMLVFDGKMDGIVVTMVLIVGTSLAAGLVGIRKPKSFKKRNMKYKSW